MNFFTLGSKFSSFEALKAALIQYKKETNVEFFIRDCKTLEQAALKKMKCAANANVDLVYHRLKLFCVRGGRNFISSSTGQRNRASLRSGCEAYIYLSLSNCKQYLEVRDYDFEHNHEIEPRPLFRKELRAENKRKRLMKKLNLTYAQVLQYEKKIKLQEGEMEKETVSSEDLPILYNENSNMTNQLETDNMTISYPENYTNKQSTEKIYTRTGDDGMASTFNGKRLNKDDNIFEAVGAVEELTSSIGFAIEFFPDMCESISEELREIQCVLQGLAVHVGTPKSFSTSFHRVNSDFSGDHVLSLESLIAKYTEKLPDLKDIILPSGGKGSSALHVARSICRRAERRVTTLAREGEVKQTSVQFLNRLGDYLFAVARYVCICDGGRESVYKKPKLMKPQRKLYIEPPPSILENKPFKGCEIIFLSQPKEEKM